METTTRALTHRRAAITAAAFVAANIALPQLCHLATLGGPTWQPIYLLTLIAAYLYGLQVGLLTAVASPVLNMAIFGMPAPAMLPIVLTKSVLLALAAAWTGQRTRIPAAIGILLTIAAYQGLGTLAQYAYTGNIDTALHTLYIGYPGIVAQFVIATTIVTIVRRHR